MNPTNTLGDVLSGNAPLKFELSLSKQTITILGVVVAVLFVAIIGVVVVAKNK
jgi:hypothetical protein